MDATLSLLLDFIAKLVGSVYVRNLSTGYFANEDRQNNLLPASIIYKLLTRALSTYFTYPLEFRI